MKLSVLAALVMATGLWFSAGASAAEPERPTTAVAADPSAATTAAEGTVQTARGSGEPSFFDRYFPFSLPNNLEPEVEENVAILWLTSVFLSPFWAPLWMPAVITGQGFPEDFVVDLVISYLLHVASQCIPFVGAAMVPLNCLYFCPVATIAIYDRNLKQKRRGSRSAAMPDREPSGLAFAEAPRPMAF